MYYQRTEVSPRVEWKAVSAGLVAVTVAETVGALAVAVMVTEAVAVVDAVDEVAGPAAVVAVMGTAQLGIRRKS